MNLFRIIEVPNLWMTLRYEAREAFASILSSRKRVFVEVSGQLSQLPFKFGWPNVLRGVFSLTCSDFFKFAAFESSPNDPW